MGDSAVLRADDVAATFIAKLGPLDAMKLQKLLYYAQGWHLAITGQPLSTDPIEAWRDGPVVPAVYARHQGWRTVSSWAAGDPGGLDPEAQQLLDLVCASYGDLSGDDLSRLTHSEAPWLEGRRGLRDDERGERCIPYDAMRHYFTGRELAGHTTADLAAGGLALEGPRGADPGFWQDLEDIRFKLQGEPLAHPSVATGSIGRARPEASLPRDTTALLAKRRQRRGIN
jgi:uncharacterized phage-associated protein